MGPTEVLRTRRARSSGRIVDKREGHRVDPHSCPCPVGSAVVGDGIFVPARVRNSGQSGVIGSKWWARLRGSARPTQSAAVLGFPNRWGWGRDILCA
jgi:hypothetical protein